jgi:murein DD-endopeptidase MepM/ murein hydrolase activator NlpD
MKTHGQMRKHDIFRSVFPFYTERYLLTFRLNVSISMEYGQGMPDLKPVIAAILGHKRWLIAVSTLPLFGMVAAFGTAPDTLTTDIVQETTIEPVTLPIANLGGTSENFDFWREERIRSGDTLQALLARMGVADDDISAILAGRDTGKLGKLLPGRTVLARVTASGRMLMFRYLSNDSTLVSIERAQGSFHIVDQTVAVQPTLVMRSGVVNHSLFGATDAADVPDSIASEMAEVFSGEIDFHRDLRKGDQFSVVYEAYLHEGRLIKTGRLMAAEFNNGGRLIQALNFIDPSGNSGYFTPEGRSLKRAFLKSPLPFTRITSGFSSSRYHPVLKEWRAHRGIDYGAPTGTPVRAVADATVNFAGKQRGYGNLVILDHARPYSTAYGHLSRFAAGMRKGTRIRQGQVIGYVGMTGLASGPHLHYEFRVDNQQRNPLAMRPPTVYSMETRHKPRFLAESAPLMQRLNLVRGHKLAALD